MNKFFWILIPFFTIYSCKNNPPNLTKITAEVVAVDSTVPSQKNIDKIIEPYKDKLEKEMNQVLAYAPVDLYKEPRKEKAETNIGNFMADVCFDKGAKLFHDKTENSLDFVLLNFGGIRAAIPKGDVTVKTAYEVMPFENSMVVVELSYDKMQELLQYIAKSKKAHPISKQLHLIIENGQIKSALLNGKELKKRNYYVLTSDYLQHGGDHMNFFKNPVNLYDLDYKIRTAILDAFKEKDTIKAKEDGRIIKNINN